MTNEKKQEKAGHPRFEPTEKQRQQVSQLAAVGTPQDQICRMIINPETNKGIGLATLNQYFREELDLGSAKSTAAVVGALYNQAINGNVTAQIFWMKTRGKWRESAQAIEITGENGGPLVAANVSIEEYLKARKEILEEY